MSSSSIHPDFAVVVDGAFDGEGCWLIRVRLRVRDGLSPEGAARLRAAWRPVVRQGVELERSRGAEAGASSFRVSIETPSPRRLRRTRARSLSPGA